MHQECEVSLLLYFTHVKNIMDKAEQKCDMKVFDN